MRGWSTPVICRAIDGPAKGFEIELPLRLCVDRMLVESKSWFGVMSDGSIAVVTTARKKRSPWVSFARYVYEKVGKVSDQRVDYRFVETVEVDRCSVVLEAKAYEGRRCRNEAAAGDELCPLHRRIAARVEAAT